MNILIYVLFYDDITEKLAYERFGHYKWAKPYRIKTQNHLFEGVMYQHELMELYDEWKDVDFVGTISYKYTEKCPINFLESIVYTINKEQHDIGGLFPIKSDRAFYTPEADDFKILKQLFSKTIPETEQNKSLLNGGDWKFSAANFWIAKPKAMLDFIEFFNTLWLPALEAHPDIWKDSQYKSTLNAEQLLKLTGRVPYYPRHPFMTERIQCAFFESKGYEIYTNNFWLSLT